LQCAHLQPRAIRCCAQRMRCGTATAGALASVRNERTLGVAKDAVCTVEQAGLYCGTKVRCDRAAPRGPIAVVSRCGQSVPCGFGCSPG
jgi:hypothetical protein